MEHPGTDISMQPPVGGLPGRSYPYWRFL